MIRIFQRKESSLLEATHKEQHEAIERLISQGRLASGYYLMLVLSTLIITPGLLVNNVAVIIGGMILAPLMIPILSLALSLVAGSVHGIMRSVRILFFSIIITFVTSATLTIILSHAYNVVSWIPERISPGVYTFIAFCSGIAAAFAWVKENLSSGIAGVAVAVSLMPPLCAASIGLALQQYLLVRNSLVLVGVNILGICIGAFLVFWILGFLSAGKVAEKVIAKNDQQ